MKKIITVATVILGFSLLLVGSASAVDLGVTTTVPQASDVTVTLTKIDSSTDPDTWLGPAASIDFGTLTVHTFTDPTDPTKVYKVFLPADDSYYAADVGVNGAGPWTIQHRIIGADFKGTGDSNLGDNIIVTFNKQTDSTTSTELAKVIMAQADMDFTSATLAGGWLRVYYGIATGDPAANEPTDSSPIGFSESAGSYSGTVRVTLLPF